MELNIRQRDQAEIMCVLYFYEKACVCPVIWWVQIHLINTILARIEAMYIELPIESYIVPI